MSTSKLDRSHDPLRRSWVASANELDTDFPIQNLPFGVFRRMDTAGAPRGGVAIGGQVLDVSSVASKLDLAEPLAACLAGSDLSSLMALPPRALTELRLAISDLLAVGSGAELSVSPHLHAMAAVDMFLPIRPGGFVDFFASIHHAANAGRIFRSNAPLLPNYKHVPIGYNGRTSTIDVSDTPVRRPCGQILVDGAELPIFGPSRRLDFEAELGIFLCGGSKKGAPVPLAEAWNHIFGFCLLNDWSARDIQAWEYQPLGPFLGKSFKTTISPWVVTGDALRPFRVPIPARPLGDPAPLAYLADAEDAAHGALDVLLETRLATAQMRREAADPVLLGAASTRELYWSPAQMIAHHTSNGCNIEAGDLYGTGTVSGDGADALGSLLEITRAGRQPLLLPNGEERRFLEDGDEVTMRGRCARGGFASIGFGQCSGHVIPALP